jgi:hypothetical protein
MSRERRRTDPCDRRGRRRCDRRSPLPVDPSRLSLQLTDFKRGNRLRKRDQGTNQNLLVTRKGPFASRCSLPSPLRLRLTGPRLARTHGGVKASVRTKLEPGAAPLDVDSTRRASITSSTVNEPQLGEYEVRRKVRWPKACGSRSHFVRRPAVSVALTGRRTMVESNCSMTAFGSTLRPE